MILSSDISEVNDDKSCVALLDSIFDAIEEVPLKSRNVQFKLKTKYLSMIATLERRAMRKNWKDAKKTVKVGKAALTEILAELEKLSMWSV